VGLAGDGGAVCALAAPAAPTVSAATNSTLRNSKLGIECFGSCVAVVCMVMRGILQRVNKPPLQRSPRSRASAFAGCFLTHMMGYDDTFSCLA
jgi:hypothetical protein